MIKKFILVVALLLASAVPSLAGTFTITVVVGGQTFTMTKNVADADITGKFAPWLVANYPNTCSPQPCTPAATTNATAYALWAAATFQGTVNNVLSWQSQQVETNALIATPPAPIVGN